MFASLEDACPHDTYPSSPNDANFIADLASVITWAGNYEEGTSLTQKAMRLNSAYPAYYVWQLGHAYCLLGQHE